MTLARAAATGSKASVFLLSGAQLYSMYLATFHKTVPYVGCSKTTLARAAATASKASLFPLSGAQLYSMYVGEGEALLRGTFKLARQAAPSILFLDEIDSLAGVYFPISKSSHLAVLRCNACSTSVSISRPLDCLQCIAFKID